MNILIDVDDTVCELVKTWLWLYNRQYNDNLVYENIIDWNIIDFVKPEAKDSLFDLINNQFIYTIVPQIDRALDGVTKLKSMGHRVIFATWAMEEASGAKYKWLKRNGFLDNQIDYIECKDKSLIRADITLDDNFNYVQKFNGMGVLFRKPWNMKESWNFCVSDWRQFVDFVIKYNDYWKRVDE